MLLSQSRAMRPRAAWPVVAPTAVATTIAVAVALVALLQLPSPAHAVPFAQVGGECPQHSTDNLDGTCTCDDSLVFDSGDGVCVPRLDVSPWALAVEESGVAGTLAMRLAAQPAATVTVTLVVNTTSDLLLSTTALTFTPGDWDAHQAVDVTGLNDFVDRGAGETVGITHHVASADPAFDGWSLQSVVYVTDIHVSGLKFGVGAASWGDATIPEGGQKVVQVRLAVQPHADVTVTLTSSDPDIATAEPANLVFTPTFSGGGLFSIAQQATIVAVSDDVDHGVDRDVVWTLSVSSAGDPYYDDLGDVTAAITVAEDDVAALVGTAGVSSSGFTVGTDGTPGVTVNEGSSQPLALSLATQPLADVTVTVTAQEPGALNDFTLSATSITFTAADWAVPQVIDVGGTVDLEAEADTEAFTLRLTMTAEGDPVYGAGGDEGSVETVLVTVVNADVAGVAVTFADGGAVGLLHEAHAATGTPTNTTIWVALKSVPVADVTVTLSPASIGGRPPDIEILDPAPAAASAPVTLVFSAATWDVPQAVLVGAVDDDVDESAPDPVATEATHLEVSTASADPFYEIAPKLAAQTADVPFEVSDDDEAALSVSAVEIDLHECAASVAPLPSCVGSSVAQVTVAMYSEPQYDVVVDLLPTSPAGVPAQAATLSAVASADGVSASLTFTAANWATPQQVTLSVAQDNVDFGTTYDVNVDITPAAGGGDPFYVPGVVATDTVEVVVVDDDVAGVVTGGETVRLDEGAPTVTQQYSLRLLSRPSADVHVSVHADDVDPGTGQPQVLAIPDSLVFEPAQWDTPQQVLVSVVADGADNEMPVHSHAITHSATSADARYDGAAVQTPTVAATIADETVVNILDLTAAPSVDSAWLSETSHELYVAFDAPTNRGGGADPTAQVLCTSAAAGYFDAGTLALFGNNGGAAALCYWDASRLIVRLADGYTVAGNSLVTILSGRIRRTALSTETVSGTVAVIGRVPAPTLHRARFNDLMTFVQVQFLGTTSQRLLGGTATSADCGDVFYNGHILGIGSVCTWESAATLRIALGVGATVLPDLREQADRQCDPIQTPRGAPSIVPFSETALYLRPGAVRAVVGGVLSAQGCVPLWPPANPPVPTAVLTPSGQNLGICDDLVLDASGSGGGGGREMTFSWSVSADTPSGAAGSDAITWLVGNLTDADTGESFRGPVVTIASADIEAGGTYTFSVSVRNVFSPDESTSSVTVSKGFLSRPSVSIDGPYTHVVKRFEPYTLLARGKPPSCPGDNVADGASMIFTWDNTAVSVEPTYPHAVVPVPEPIDMALPAFKTLNAFSTLIPAFTLAVGATYRVTVVGEVSTNSALWNDATIDIYVSPGQLRALIAGGAARTVGTANAITVDATQSFDEDAISQVKMHYAWSCGVADTSAAAQTGDNGGPAPLLPCTDFSGLDITAALPSGIGARSLYMPAGTLTAGDYTFTVTITKGTAGAPIPTHLRTAQASQVVTIVPGNPPAVTVAQFSEKVNRGSTVRLEGVAVDKNGQQLTPGAGTKVVWSQVVGDLNFPAEGDPASPTSPLLTSVSLLSIKLRPGVLTPGAQYTFRMAVETPDGIGSSAVTLTVNRPPSSGTVEAAPSSISVSEEMVLSTTKWVDDATDLPLSYQFSYTKGAVDDATSGETRLRGFTATASITTTQLPQGSGATGVMSIAVYVRDRLGAEARSHLTAAGTPLRVSVLPFVAASEEEQLEFMSSMTDGLSDVTTQQDPNGILAQVSMLAAIFNDPCGGRDCNFRGVCAFGVCTCDDGYEGADCEVVSAVDGNWGDWSEWSACTRSCGPSGTRTRSRACQGQRGAGRSCEQRHDAGEIGAATATQPCNTNVACQGNTQCQWSDWSAWSSCSNACPNDAGGDYSGVSVRTRSFATAPSSDDPALACPGAASETVECNKALCPWPTKACPGSTRDPDTYEILSECTSALNGECERLPVGAPCPANSADCTAVCVCEDGWNGAQCDVSDAEMNARLGLRSQMIGAAAQALTQLNADRDTFDAQSGSLSSASSTPEELTAAAMLEALEMVGALGLLADGVGFSSSSSHNLMQVLDSVLEGNSVQVQRDYRRRLRRRRRLQVVLDQAEADLRADAVAHGVSVAALAAAHARRAGLTADYQDLDTVASAGLRSGGLYYSGTVHGSDHDHNHGAEHGSDADGVAGRAGRRILSAEDLEAAAAVPPRTYEHEGARHTHATLRRRMQDITQEDAEAAEAAAEQTRALVDEVRGSAAALGGAILSTADNFEEPSTLSTGNLEFAGQRQDPAQGLQTLGEGTANEVSFPDELSASLAGDGYGGGGGSGVDVTVLRWRVDPLADASVQGGDSLVSGVTDITVSAPGAAGGELSVSGLDAPVVFSMPVRPALFEALLARDAGNGLDAFGAGTGGATGEDAAVPTPLCSYFDAAMNGGAGGWSTRGVVLVGYRDGSGGGSGGGGAPVIVCAAGHLTSFAATSAVTSALSNVQSPFADAGILAQALDPSNVVSTIVVLCLLLCFCMLWCRFHFHDRRDARDYAVLRRVKFVSHGHMTPMGDPRKGAAEFASTPAMRDARNALGVSRIAGSAASAYTSSVRSVRTLGSKSLRTIKSGYDRSKTCYSQCERFFGFYFLQIVRYHKWVSTMAPPIQDRLLFTRPQRITTLLASCLVAMAWNALFLGRDPSRVDSRIATGVVSALFMIPSDIVFPVLFELVNTFTSETHRRRRNAKRERKARRREARKAWVERARRRAAMRHRAGGSDKVARVVDVGDDLYLEGVESKGNPTAAPTGAVGSASASGVAADDKVMQRVVKAGNKVEPESAATSASASVSGSHKGKPRDGGNGGAVATIAGTGSSSRSLDDAALDPGGYDEAEAAMDRLLRDSGVVLSPKSAGADSDSDAGSASSTDSDNDGTLLIAHHVSAAEAGTPARRGLQPLPGTTTAADGAAHVRQKSAWELGTADHGGNSESKATPAKSGAASGGKSSAVSAASPTRGASGRNVGGSSSSSNSSSKRVTAGGGGVGSGRNVSTRYTVSGRPVTGGHTFPEGDTRVGSSRDMWATPSRKAILDPNLYSVRSVLEYDDADSDDDVQVPASQAIAMGMVPALSALIMGALLVFLGLYSFVLIDFGKMLGIFMAVTGAVTAALAGAGASLAWRRKGLVGLSVAGAAIALCIVAYVVFTANIEEPRDGSAPSGLTLSIEDALLSEWESKVTDTAEVVSTRVQVFQDEFQCCGFERRGFDELTLGSEFCDEAIVNGTAPVPTNVARGCVDALQRHVQGTAELLFIVAFAAGGAFLLAVTYSLWRAVVTPRPEKVRIRLPAPGTYEAERAAEAATIIERMFRGVHTRVAMTRLQEITLWERFHVERTLLLSLVYGALWIYILMAAYVNVVFGIQFNQSQTISWMLATLVAYVFDILVSESFIVLLIAIALKMRGGAASKAREATDQLRRIASRKGLITV